MTARRARNEGSVYFDASAGRWTGSVSLGTVNGRRVRRKVSGRNRTEVRNKLAGLVSAHRAAGTVPRGDITVGHLITDLLEHPPTSWKSEITVKVNTSHAKRIRSALGNVKVTKLTVVQVEAFLGQLAEQGYSASVIGDTRSLLRTALRRAERDYGLLRNVAAPASRPSPWRCAAGSPPCASWPA